MEKQIGNPAGAFAIGGTYGTPPVDNAMTTEIAPLINGTGLVLFTGDIVALDATGTQAILAAGAADTTMIGAVGSSIEMGLYPATASFPVQDAGINMGTTDGTAQPQVDFPWVSATMGFTNGSATITYAGAAATDLGKYIYTPYNSSTNANPQVFQVTAVSVGVNYTGTVVAGAGTTFSGTTGSFIVQLGRDLVTKGPGWSPAPGWSSTSIFPPNVTVPVIVRGFGRVNINGVAGVVRGDYFAATAASSVIAARTAAAGGLAASIGTFLGVSLEAYAARDTTLSGLGYAGHDSVRAYIGKF